MSRRRVFGSLLGVVFLANFARVVFAPLVEPLMATFQVGEATAGVVATLVWLGSAVARIPTGFLLTRYSRQRVIVGAGGLLAGGAAAAWLAPTVPLLGVAALLMGVGSGAYFIAANPLVSELFPERVGRAIGTHYTASQVAAVVAGPLVTLALVAAVVVGVVAVGTASQVCSLSQLFFLGGGVAVMLSVIHSAWVPIGTERLSLVGGLAVVCGGLLRLSTTVGAGGDSPSA